jgi:ArsR family transcriptional regulator
MEENDAVDAFSALSAPSRLKVLRVVAATGKLGIPSGEVTRQLGLTQSTASTQLLLLSNARLVRSERQGRVIRYWANFGNMRALVEFIAKDCSAGKVKYQQLRVVE